MCRGIYDGMARASSRQLNNVEDYMVPGMSTETLGWLVHWLLRNEPGGRTSHKYSLGITARKAVIGKPGLASLLMRVVSRIRKLSHAFHANQFPRLEAFCVSYLIDQATVGTGSYHLRWDSGLLCGSQ